MRDLIDILLLQGGYNTTVVCVGAALLGIGGGVVGVFSMLRKQALISDAISHATLPGVSLAFIVAVALGGNGRNLPVLLAGSALSAALGVLAVQWIKNHTRLPEDAAIGTVLSVFFGLGIVLMSHVQTMQTGGQAGLESFLLGATAGMLQSEAELIGVAAALVIVAALSFLKEFGLVCFDPEYAAAQGWPVAKLDLLIMALLLSIVTIGLKTVGLILIIALVIIPPVAARFWTERLSRMLAIAAIIGGLGAYGGAAISASAPNLPTGGIIVLTLAALFGLSLLFAPARGLIAAAIRQLQFRYAVMIRQTLLAALSGRSVRDPFSRWMLRARGYLDHAGLLTDAGRKMACEFARDQALWEHFLRVYPGQVFALDTWGTKRIENVLPSDLINELESRIAK
jgi:manganese/zinc/iron transport system permease protein